MEQYVSKIGTIHCQKWNDTLPSRTIQDKIETIQTNIVTEGMLGRVLS